jgi:WD40 repeat protein
LNGEGSVGVVAMGRRRVWPLAVLAGSTVLVAYLGSLAVNAATDQQKPWPGPLKFLEAYPFAAVALLAGIGLVVAVVAAWWEERPRGGTNDPPPPPLVPVPKWVVERPVQVADVVRVLSRRGWAGGVRNLVRRDVRGATVALTTALQGAGGFGKTTLAAMVCADWKVRRHFGDRIYTITIGRDAVSRPSVAAKVNDLIYLITGASSGFDDPQLAAQELGRVLEARRRILVVIDDVWDWSQLEPFLVGGRRSARLVTTRVRSALPPEALPVLVDEMSDEQARVVLTWEVPGLSQTVASRLLALTGRWPLLLRLVNRAIVDLVETGLDASVAGTGLAQRLEERGPTAVDPAGHSAAMSLDVPALRAKAVRATIEASSTLLPGEGAARLAELGIFAEDESVPMRLVTALWQSTGGLDEVETRDLCRRMAHLSLIDLTPHGGGVVRMHDVVRDYLRGLLQPTGIRAATRAMLRLLEGQLPPAKALDPTGLGARAAWWNLVDGRQYLRDHLVMHLLDAGDVDQAEAVACDLRWVAGHVAESGVVGAATDLMRVNGNRAVAMRAGLRRAAHLLAPNLPPEALVDTLCSRLRDDQAWSGQVMGLNEMLERTRLVNRWPLPDQPEPGVIQILTGHTGAVLAVAVSPDGTWLASGDGADGAVRIWDAVTGAHRATLTGHTGALRAVAVSPDGTWLASGGDDWVVRIWDAVTGAHRVTLTGHTGALRAVAVSPDGTWLASGGEDRTVRIWDAVTGAHRVTLTGHTGAVGAVAVSPDGTWLASGGEDRAVRIWDAVTGEQRATVIGHTGKVFAVAVSPDGTWLASGGQDRTVRIWDAVTGAQRATLTGHKGPVGAVAVSSDGTWMASGGQDRTVRIWDAVTGAQRATLTGHTGAVSAVSAVAVSPDGTWLASGGEDRAVQIWHAVTEEQRATLTGHTGAVWAVAVSPDGTWMASGGQDRTVRIWDAVTGALRATVTGYSGAVWAVAVSPDGTWLASGGGDDGAVRIWDALTGTLRATVTGYSGAVLAVEVSPDGTWLACASDDGVVRIWDAVTRALRATLTSHTGAVFALAVSPDGTWLASGGEDRTVRIWDSVTGAHRNTLIGHTGAVGAVAVSPDGTWLASGGEDRTVRIWDAVTGAQRAALTGHTGAVWAVSVSPDGTWLASAGSDQTVRIWSGNACVAILRVNGSLTAARWLPEHERIVVAGAAGLYQFELRPIGRRSTSFADTEFIH